MHLFLNFFLYLGLALGQTPVLEKDPSISEKPDINNIANSCVGQKENDPICKTLSRAIHDYKDFEKRSIEIMLEKINLGKYEIYTASGLSMLINRRITIKQRSFLSDKIFQTLDLTENEAIISLEYNF